jgi:hypothetical protein
VDRADQSSVPNFVEDARADDDGKEFKNSCQVLTIVLLCFLCFSVGQDVS